MRLLFKATKKELERISIAIAKRYIHEKYNSYSRICVLSGESKKVIVDIGEGHEVRWEPQPNIGHTIRKQCGELTLLRYGLPKKDAEPHLVILLPMPSLIRSVGLKEYIKLIKDWPGVSKVGSIDAVKYKLI